MRILVVEDEHKIANAIKKGLEQEHFVVDTAFDGSEGYDLATGEKYDLIILDRLLPEMDGLTICKKLRQAKNQAPVLLLTALSQTADKIEGLNSGADDYLPKPFAFEELLARVKALLRRPQLTESEILSARDISLNTGNFTVKRGLTRIELSHKEYQLLEYLLRNKNKIVTKEQIMAHVWDYEANILPNTIEVFIKHLREKIDKPFPNLTPLIRTLRGFGYKIEE